MKVLLIPSTMFMDRKLEINAQFNLYGMKRKFFINLPTRSIYKIEFYSKKNICILVIYNNDSLAVALVHQIQIKV